MKREHEWVAREWHAMSDHAADGTPFGGGLCNCEKQADRIAALIAKMDRPVYGPCAGDGCTNRTEKSHPTDVCDPCFYRTHDPEYVPPETPLAE